MSEVMEGAAIRVENLSKAFVLHVQGGVRLPVFDRLSLQVASSECLALYGPPGSGKSTLLRSRHATYMPAGGRDWVRHAGESADGWVYLAATAPYRVLEGRRRTVGYGSEFSRVFPCHVIEQTPCG